MMDTLRIGLKFSSFEEFDIVFKNYKEQKFSDFSIADSKTLDRIKKRFSGSRIQNAPPELKYYYIKYTCVHGGFYDKKVTTGERSSSTMKRNCPALLILKLSEDGKSLEVVNFIEIHNHELSSEQFMSLPKQRRLDAETQQEIVKLMQLKANKKLLRKKYSALTGKKITSRDLSNLRVKAKSRNFKGKPQPSNLATSLKLRTTQVSSKQISKSPNVEVEPQPSDSATSLKLRAAQDLTNKLAMLMSESPFFQEQLSFLQTVYDSWANGNISLEIRNKGPTDLSRTSRPESLSGLIPNKGITETSVSSLSYLLLPLTKTDAASSNDKPLSRLPVKDSNVSALYVNVPSDFKIRGRPKGLRATNLPLKKQRKTGTVPDPTPSTSGTAMERDHQDQTHPRKLLTQNFLERLHILKQAEETFCPSLWHSLEGDASSTHT